MHETPPPVAKYRLTVEITGNTHGEVEHELLLLTRGGYLHDSDYYTRDEWSVIGGRSTRRMEHANPDMTPERYDVELESWWSTSRGGARPSPTSTRRTDRMTAHPYQTIAHDASISATPRKDEPGQVEVEIACYRDGVELDLTLYLWTEDFLRMADAIREHEE